MLRVMHSKEEDKDEAFYVDSEPQWKELNQLVIKTWSNQPTEWKSFVNLG